MAQGVVAALATLTFSYMARHGESFRADPLISVKTAIYVPAVACMLAVLVLEMERLPRRRRLLGTGVFIAATAMAYAGFHLYHAAAMAAARAQVIRSAIASGGGMLSGAQLGCSARGGMT